MLQCKTDCKVSLKGKHRLFVWTVGIPSLRTVCLCGERKNRPHLDNPSKWGNDGSLRLQQCDDNQMRASFLSISVVFVYRKWYFPCTESINAGTLRDAQPDRASRSTKSSSSFEGHFLCVFKSACLILGGVCIPAILSN